MARIQKPPAGRLFIAIVHSHIDACAEALGLLERQFGKIVAETTDLPFGNEDNYAEEMGPRLLRRLFCFDRSVERDRLPEIKSTCTKLESQFGDKVGDYTFRTVNLDPGILTPDQVVIASHREYNYRIYLGEGVFAELALVWSRNGYVRLPWTSPDLYHDEAIDFFMRSRETFEQTRKPELLRR